MATSAPPLPAADQPLGTFERIIDVFIAPTKTFTDLKRSSSWWAAFLVMAVLGYVLVFAAANKVGWEQIFENRMRMAPKQAEKMEQMPAEQRARVVQIQVAVLKYAAFAWPVILLIYIVIVAAVLMATFNFGFGAQVPFKTALAIAVFARLPNVIKGLLAALTLFLGANVENFTFENPLGSNPAYYVGSNTPLWQISLLSAFDVFAIWVIVLTGLGFACVSKVKKGTAIGVVAAWYILLTLIGVLVAFATG
jgi:Yip1-like protein